MLDITANRRARKWSKSELIARTLWELLRSPLFAWSPRIFWAWRVIILRAFGARIGSNVHVHPSVKIAIPWNLDIGDNVGIGDEVILYSLGKITIGSDATISQYAHLCAGTHDNSLADMPLVKSIISIGDGVWVCTDAFIGPDVEVGEYAVVGARAVAIRDIEPFSVVAGNPALTIKMRKITKRRAI